MKYKFILRYTILLLCLAFVIERSVQCFNRFFKKPQAVEIKMTDGTNDILPHFTFCSKTRYNPNVFEECGLEIISDFMNGIKWVGNGTENYCKDPKLFMEKAKVNLTRMMGKVILTFDHNDREVIYPQNQSFWKFFEDSFFGCCHTFFIPESYPRNKPIKSLEFALKNNVFWMVNSPEYIITDGTFMHVYKMTDTTQIYKITYEVFHMLDYNSEVCEDDTEYTRDKCNDDSIFKESMEKVNCTWPFVKNKNHICTDLESAQMAKQIGRTLRRRNPKCSNTCKYLKATIIPLSTQSKFLTKNELHFFFPESIKTHQAYFAYDKVSLLAEIGGYVGLCLGWSVYQIADLLDLIYTLKRKQ